MKIKKIVKIISEVILGIGLLLILIALIISAVDSIKEYLSDDSDKPTYYSDDEPTTSGTTPCHLTYNYKARVEAEGAVKIVYPGVSDTIYWDGKSELPNPGRKKGPVYYWSNVPNKPNLWVKIWKE